MAEAGELAFARTVMEGLEVASKPQEGPVPVGGARYGIGSMLGEGGMGCVLEAHDRQFARTVAIKRLRRELSGSQARERFTLEALVTGNLEHSGVPTVYERGELSDGSPFYAMHLVKGETLAQRIAGAPSLEARLKLIPVVIKVAQTLGYAHERGVVHRDVKPENVIVGRYGEVALLDWGIAKVRGIPSTASSGGEASIDRGGGGLSSRTRHGAIVGTPAYMAPEQANGQVDLVDERTDVFALGALLYHLLSGRAPYSGPSAQAVIARAANAELEPLAAAAPKAPAGLRAICEKAMAKDARDRHRTAAEVAEALESHVAAAVAGNDAGAVRWFANLGSVAGFVVMIVATFFIWQNVSSLKEQGYVGYFPIAMTLLGSSLAGVDLVTKGRHKLSSIVFAFALATLFVGIAATFQDVDMVLRVAMMPKYFDDPTMYRQVMTRGLHESTGGIATSAVMSALQLVVWAIARRRVQLAER